MTRQAALKIIRTGPDERKQLSARLGLRGKMNQADVVAATETIIRQVRQDGDDTLLELTARFDKVRLTAGQLRVTEREISEAIDLVD
ncbi:MAG: histidinol dehydrogenase, partial [Clostridiaceae bacterium]|nr:histidinol dehydrogenase [Clostridiaceae bacterium]